MYRYKAFLNKICVDNYSFSLRNRFVYRTLCTDNKSDDKSKKEPTKSKKFSGHSKSVVVQLQKKTNDVSKGKVDPKEKLDSLLKKSTKFESISPNDDKSASKFIGKPKTFIRQSAREHSDTLPVDNVEPANELSRGLDKRLVEAALRVANKMPKHLAKDTEKKLLESIHEHKKETIEEKKKYMKQNEIKQDYTKSISYQIMKDLQKENRMESQVVKIGLKPQPISRSRSSSLFTGECLKIFDPKGLYLNTELNRNLFFEKLTENEKEMSMNFPPENAFEEMIRWTEEGKLWKFPINNEQGLEAEEDVPFYEHVLLDNLLEGFPSVGPVRQFMELILIGLSHNAYISVERKHEIVDFYRNFFNENHSLIHINEQQETQSV